LYVGWCGDLLSRTGELRRHSIKEDKPAREVFQAQAMGQSTQLGRTFGVTINIEQYSTSEERQVLADAFQQAGSEGLFNALDKMHSKGRIAITGTLGYDISFVRKISTADGYKIRVQTNRPIWNWRGMGEWKNDGLQPLCLRNETEQRQTKNTGVLLPACKFKIDKKTKEL
jgi:hypothetical protein